MYPNYPYTRSRCSILLTQINSMTSKDTETTINEDGAKEINVETVDYRKPAGEDQEPEKEKVEITHVIKPEDDKPGPTNIVAGAAGKVAETIQSAKQAVSEYAAGKKDEDEKKQ